MLHTEIEAFAWNVTSCVLSWNMKHFFLNTEEVVCLPDTLCSHHSYNTWSDSDEYPTLFASSSDFWGNLQKLSVLVEAQGKAAAARLQFVMMVFFSSALSQQLSWRGKRLQVLKHLCWQESTQNKLLWLSVFWLLPIFLKFIWWEQPAVSSFGVALLFSYSSCFDNSCSRGFEHGFRQCYINAEGVFHSFSLS